MSASDPSGQPDPHPIPSGTVDELLVDLRAVFDADVAARRSKHPPIAGCCRYCGCYLTANRPGLDAHLGCIVSPEFIGYLCEVVRRPDISFTQIGAALGVDPATARRWWRRAS